ncbi:Mu-like prophage FluMu protein gp28 [Aggregatibacter aphrophilus ATCC 33389]|uniref:Mu-like prophage FluMu protein gp28 n=1 Tax=Aggregatibacter aphrophilus ATCC 33389 TaxID=985008 RepID=A0A448F5Q2_AGGAP|nr:Mu-like prophage FluMu protein gp28 [Aggregatibacter aphrophilus ATCC 33389]
MINGTASGCQNIKRYESGLIQIPQDEEIILDQGHIVVINGVPKIDRARNQGKSGQRHGDSAVSYCMAVRASYMTGGEIEFTPLPAKHQSATGGRNFEYSNSEKEDLKAEFGSDWDNI